MEIEYNKCAECFNEEHEKYLECLSNKLPKYQLAVQIANSLTISVLQITDHQAGSNWNLYMMLEDPKKSLLKRNEIDLILVTYKEILRDLLKKDEEELRQIYLQEVC